LPARARSRGAVRSCACPWRCIELRCLWASARSRRFSVPPQYHGRALKSIGSRVGIAAGEAARCSACYRSQQIAAKDKRRGGPAHLIVRISPPDFSKTRTAIKSKRRDIALVDLEKNAARAERGEPAQMGLEEFAAQGPAPAGWRRQKSKRSQPRQKRAVTG